MAVLQLYLPDIWFLILGFILFIYLALDGFDLGIGIYSLLPHGEGERGLMISAIEGIWHANQTWLVILGTLFFAAFPLAYGVALSALYIPITIMVFGLIFRGAAIEFHSQSQKRDFWERAFGFGSFVAALAQGVALGGLAGGLRVQGDRFTGGVWDWLTPSSVLFALGVALLYLVLGATCLIMKTEGDLQEKSARFALRSSYLLFLVLACAFAGLVVFRPASSIAYLPAAAAAAVGAFLVFSLRKGRERAPFFWSLAVLSIGCAAAAVNLYPMIIPPHVTIAMAASPAGSQTVMLLVVVVLIPVILLYNAHQYRVFSGKVTADVYGETKERGENERV